MKAKHVLAFYQMPSGAYVSCPPAWGSHAFAALLVQARLPAWVLYYPPATS